MRARILIVDDEPALRRTLERALTSLNYEVISVADPHAAYQMLGESTFDAVLLDLRLPQIPGDTLLLAIVRRWPRLLGKIILMSGDPLSDQQWPVEVARCPILAKPFSLETLAQTVGAVLVIGESSPDLLEGKGHG